ncbi:MAG: cupredoxin domain-containing protein [Acetobacteraceae bacterium]|nr:cupredoxin domain-containing protein [Acetobacteraceae bacterium]
MRSCATQALCLAAASLAVMSAAALAQVDLPTVGQKDRAFSRESLEIRAGGSVRFQNDDSVAHNVVVRDPGGATRTSPLQRPGDKTDIAFAAAGEYDVRCALHPRMRMTVRAQ